MNNPFSRKAPREVMENARSLVWTALAALVIFLMIFNLKLLAYIFFGLIALIIAIAVSNSIYKVIRYMAYGARK